MKQGPGPESLQRAEPEVPSSTTSTEKNIRTGRPTPPPTPSPIFFHFSLSLSVEEEEGSTTLVGGGSSAELVEVDELTVLVTDTDVMSEKID